MFKPTVTRVIVSALVIFFFVPFIQLSEPECQGFGAQPIRGDGPQSIVCHDGISPLFSYLLLSTRGTIWSNQNAELFHWKLSASPNYLFLLLGSVGVYAGVCYLTHLFPKQKKYAKGKEKGN